jgi:glycosyltransferase involved in cell wall biosynthesis
MPRVLVLDEEVPWPANTGKRLRTLNLLTALAHEFHLDLLVHQSDGAPDGEKELRRRNIRVHIADSRLPRKGGVSLPFRIAASLSVGLPYSVYSHKQAGYSKRLDALCQAQAYDLVHCEWTPYAAYAGRFDLPVTIAAHNVEWQIWDRMTQAERRPVHRRLFQLQASLMRRFEQDVFRRFKHVTAVSAEDAAAIRALGCEDVEIVPNGVDVDFYAPPQTANEDARTLVFTGSMDWLANQDAIRWFINDVHPLLKQRVDYRLYVVGRTPPAWMMDRSIVPAEVTVTGTVDDVRPYIARSAVYVVPLRVGGGSRLKILEALAMARPVVSTAVGAEGLELTPGTHLLVADEPSTFVETICRLFADAHQRRALGAAGRAHVEARYTWRQIAPAQSALWRRAIGNGRSSSGGN